MRLLILCSGIVLEIDIGCVLLVADALLIIAASRVSCCQQCLVLISLPSLRRDLRFLGGHLGSNSVTAQLVARIEAQAVLRARSSLSSDLSAHLERGAVIFAARSLTYPGNEHAV